MDKKIWQEKCKKFKVTMNEVLNEFERIYGEEYLNSYSIEKEKFHKHLAQNRLIDIDKKRNTSLEKIAAFHIYGGSTPDYELSPFFDFSGELSIVKYWEKILEKLKQIPKH